MENIQIKSGVVTKIEEDRIAVQLLPTKSGECGTSCHCNFLVMIEKSKGTSIWIKGNYKKKFKVTDFVTIEANLPSPYISIFFLFISPILGLFLGAIFGYFLAEKYFLVNQQNFSIIGAGIGFLITMGIAILFDSKIQKKKEVFKIQEISSLDKEACKECRNMQKAI